MLNIKIAGTGCPNCVKLFEMCSDTVKELGIEAGIEKITDVKKITKLGISLTPGLIINGKIKSAGKLPVKSTLVQWIITELALQL